MPKKCKGKRNALVVTVAAVLLGDIFAGGQNIPAQQTTWNAGDTKRTQMTESATRRMDLTDAFAVIFFGTTFAFGFADMVPNREPYHVMNAVALIFILALDFLLRIPFQKTPTQEVKPYLLLPVKRNRIIDFLLIRSGLSLFNQIGRASCRERV